MSTVEPSANAEQQVQLGTLLGSEWFQDASESAFTARFYSLFGIPIKYLSRVLPGPIAPLNHDGWVVVRIAQIRDLKYQKAILTITPGDDGRPVIKAKVDDVELEDAPYLLLMTPNKIDGVTTDEFTIRSRLDQTAALYRGLVGHNIARELTAELMIEVGTSKISCVSNVVSPPNGLDGPIINKANWLLINEISDCIAQLHPNKKQQMILSLQLFNQSFGAEFSYSLCWTAIEVACSGTAPKIKSVLKKAYEIKKGRYVEDDLRFDLCEGIRHDFVHNGLPANIGPQGERYLQWLYIDVIRQALGLSCHKFVSSYLTTPSLFIERLNVDNRTAEQKKTWGKDADLTPDQLEADAAALLQYWEKIAIGMGAG